MRSLVLTLLITTTAASAWERAATEAEATWHWLQNLLIEDGQATEAHMTSHGVVIEDFNRLRAYVKRAQDEIAAAVEATIQEACVDRAVLENDPDQLIRALNRVTEVETAAIENAIANLPDAIGQSDALSLQHFATHETGTRTGGVDPIDIVRHQDFEAKAFVERFCNLKRAAQ
jgi:hypothetical protein